MSDARAQILASIRRSLKRGPLDAQSAEAIDRRVTEHRRGPALSRVALDHDGLVALFCEMATAVQATIAKLAGRDEIPAALAEYLASQKSPARLVVSPALGDLPWAERPTLEPRFGAAVTDDVVSLTPAFVGIAETGTLMLPSGHERPATLNFLPATHIAVLSSSDIVGSFEDGWDRWRQKNGSVLPRTVNFITGPSRTADIEQKILLGAHGPRHLHILLIDARA